MLFPISGRACRWQTISPPDIIRSSRLARRGEKRVRPACWRDSFMGVLGAKHMGIAELLLSGGQAAKELVKHADLLAIGMPGYLAKWILA